MNSKREKLNELFKEEVKSILTGYLGSDPDAVNYITLNITRLHNQHIDETFKTD